MRAEWLADVLRAAGLKVVEVPGWQSRGRDLQVIYGVVCHHTAIGPSAKDSSVVNILVTGRSDLPGPLSQLGLARDATYYVVAAGKANHNGFGRWGNSSLGIEAFNDGRGEPWPAAQVDAYKRGVAAILSYLRLLSLVAQGHKETDPYRKIDPKGIDMPSFRSDVGRYITTPPDAGDDFLMALTPQAQQKLVDDAAAANLRSAVCQYQLTTKAKGPDGTNPTVLLRLDRIDRVVRAVLEEVRETGVDVDDLVARAVAAADADATVAAPIEEQLAELDQA